MVGLKTWIRKMLSVVMFHGYYRLFRSWDVSRSGKPLKDGITAVVSARNEEYIIAFCLKSLVGVVDQVVCIDNGSDDETLAAMRMFESKYGSQIEVTILEMPGALLGDCRNAGLDYTDYKWHLRWDADMVCRTSGAGDMKQLRKMVLKNDRPRTIQLPRTNLRGDFHHTRKNLPAIDPGEPIMVRFGRDIEYVEYGKFDAIKVPFYYAITEEEKRYYFHCEGLKSDDNMVYRRQYFEWREAFNKYNDSERPQEISDFELYKKSWIQEEFGTFDPLSIKWRFQREWSSRLVAIDKKLFGDYPDTLKEEMNRKDGRFEVLLKDGAPFIRIDRTDKEMIDYEPTDEDLAWAELMPRATASS
jgi:glycosyltransferase involved in cell wall biosynthesis